MRSGTTSSNKTLIVDEHQEQIHRIGQPITIDDAICNKLRTTTLQSSKSPPSSYECPTGLYLTTAQQSTHHTLTTQNNNNATSSIVTSYTHLRFLAFHITINIETTKQRKSTAQRITNKAGRPTASTIQINNIDRQAS